MTDNDNPLKQLVSTFSVNDTSYDNTLAEDIHINKGDLTGDFALHSEKFAYWATMYELALDHETRAKVDLERLYALLDSEKRTQLKLTGDKVTETQIEKAVIVDIRYVEAQNMVLDATRQVGLLKCARDAMIHRKDMLVSLGANYRAEGRSSISLMTEQYLSDKKKEDK